MKSFILSILLLSHPLRIFFPAPVSSLAPEETSKEPSKANLNQSEGKEEEEDVIFVLESE